MNTFDLFEKIRAFISSPLERPGPALDRSPYERFAIPFTFKPQLSISEAAIAVGGDLIRIFFGSLLFALWGALAYLAWRAVPFLVLRVAVLMVLVVVLAVAMVLLMLGISALGRIVWPRRSEASPKVSPHI